MFLFNKILNSIVSTIPKDPFGEIINSQKKAMLLT